VAGRGEAVADDVAGFDGCDGHFVDAFEGVARFPL
jgi:hypothetical protein